MASRLTSTAGEEVFPQNRLRKSFVVQNEDLSINMFLKRETPGTLTVSATDHDHLIAPGGAIGVSNVNDGLEAIQDRWTIIAASGTPRMSFFETEDVRR